MSSFLESVAKQVKKSVKRQVMKTFISSQFGYYRPLVCFFCSRLLNNSITFIFCYIFFYIFSRLHNYFMELKPHWQKSRQITRKKHV